MPPKIRLPNKTLWGLEDIVAICLHSRPKLRRSIERAERLADLPLVADLARLSNDMADIDRLARDARQGKYVGTASKQDDD